MEKATAVANPNIAFVKYWGKTDEELNLPANPSLSMNLAALTTVTTVEFRRDLPADLDALRGQLLTSTTREDFRRIRRANFTYRVTSDPDAIREFHARQYAPLVKHRFPEDGQVGLLKSMLNQGGELVCADLDGE